jgi:uncharacterized repeat protein (TIGR03803 family)
MAMPVTLTTLVSFNGTDGSFPAADLLVDAQGDLFGTTSEGGANNAGTVFEIVKTGAGYATVPTTLATFNYSSAAADGAIPDGSLIADTNGDLFVTTQQGGGATGEGAVFEIVKTASGYTAPINLVSFTGTNGSFPLGSLFADANGNLLGTTFEGGGSDGGTVFQITPIGFASTFTNLFSFNGTNGVGPTGSLIADAKGDLFGTTQGGGANNHGTVFEIAKTATGYASSPTTLVSFSGTNGAEPQGSLITDTSGNLFGTTKDGGGNGDGTVFEITPTGFANIFTTLVSFNGPDGSFPEGSLIADAKGDLFGTTSEGGANNAGTVFEIVKTGAGYASLPTTLLSFNGTNGSAPVGSLTTDASGNLFGTTAEGGANGKGTAFELTGSGFVVLAITGAVANQAVNDNATIDPFTTVTVTDLNTGQTVTVTPSNTANGTLFDPNAVTDGSTIIGGVYKVTGTAAAVTADLDALVFHPTAHQVAPGGTATTGFTIVATDTAGATASDSTTSVVTTAIGVPPTVTGTVANQHAFISTPIHLLADVVIGDVNFGQQETVSVTPSPTTGGRLSDPHAGTDGSHIVNGVYTVTGTAAAVTTDLQGLLFTATRTGTTDVTIKVTDTAGEMVTDHTTSVVGVYAFHPFFF